MGGTLGLGPRRLSKPRTRNSSSNLLTSPDQPTQASSPVTPSEDMEYFGEHATTVASQGERRSRRKSRTKLRAYLYGSTDEVAPAVSSDEEEEGQNGFAGAARGAKKRLSRTGSSIMQLSSAKASTIYLSTSSNSRLLLSSDPEESARVAEKIKEMAHHDSLAAQNHVSSPVDEDKHVDSIMAPLRRRSLYTPGIATRHPNDILRKPPPPPDIQSQEIREYYYNPAYPESSPLSRLAALNGSEDGRSSPSDLHITHLGGLRLGTLHVTNGTASPTPNDSTPSILYRSPTPESHIRKYYYTASGKNDYGGRICPANIEATQLESAVEKPSRPSSSLRYKTNESVYAPEDDQLQRPPRKSFSFRQSFNDHASNIATEYMSEFRGSPFARSESPPLREGQVGNDSFDDEGIYIPNPQPPTIDIWESFHNDGKPQHTNTGTQEEAFEKLNSNALAAPEPQRPSIPSSLTSRYSSSLDPVPKTDSGYSSNSSLDTSRANDREMGNGEVDIPSPQAVPIRSAMKTRSVSGPREIPQTKLEKEPGVSKIDSPLEMRPTFSVIPRHQLAKLDPNVSSTGSLETVNTLRSSARSSSQNIIRKLQKPRPNSQPPPVNLITVQGYCDLTQANIPRVPSVIAAKHAERLKQFPLLEHTFPSSQHVSTNHSPSPVEGYPFPIRFPSPANPLEAATAGWPNPLPTRDVDNKFKNRSYSQQRESMSYEDDEWTASDIVRSPSWSDFGGGRKRREQKRLAKEERETEKRLLKEERELEKRLQKDKRDLEKQMKKDDIKQKSSLSHDSSRRRGKSSERRLSQHETLETIADFGTVTESLGGSPYDITTAMFTKPSQNPKLNNRHPHQMSTSMPRTKSSVGMDEATAVAFARSRSRTRSESFGRTTGDVEEGLDYPGYDFGRNIRPQAMSIDAKPVPAVSVVDLEANDLDRARSWNQRQRYSEQRDTRAHHASFNDRGGIPGRLIRPHSMYVDVPPVPSLPSSEQVKQREAQITRSRPHSMIIDDAPMQTRACSKQAELEGDRKSDNENLTPTPPQKSKAASLAVPGLWSSGSLERKITNDVEQPSPSAHVNDLATVEVTASSEVDDVWEAQKQAWRQRRECAGENLLLRTQLSEIFTTENSPPAHSPTPTRNNARTTAVETRFSAMDSNDDPVIPKPRTNPSSFSHATPHHPPPPQPTRPPPTPLTAPSRTPPPPGPLSHPPGRYEGGLLYAYEPGLGLGGSAGTRGGATAASRKSVDVSRGFGVDLSDVPVFVAAVGR